eukprot:TRINITY_DN44657_c0_g1_i1.p1 TRINITY_DN44657_c0_g1~~TRINITY_DN44657_c0_g1_i1.p1  ORF type:complete len:791 (+),score=144.83 TRINITY_DN44657_c0_g1_i1:28-2373(+)
MAHPQRSWDDDLLEHDLMDVDRERLLAHWELENPPELLIQPERGADGWQRRPSRFQALRSQQRLVLVASLGALSLVALVLWHQHAGESLESAEPRLSGAIQRLHASGSETLEASSLWRPLNVKIGTGYVGIGGLAAASREAMDKLKRSQGNASATAATAIVASSTTSATLVPASAGSTSAEQTTLSNKVTPPVVEITPPASTSLSSSSSGSSAATNAATSTVLNTLLASTSPSSSAPSAATKAAPTSALRTLPTNIQTTTAAATTGGLITPALLPGLVTLAPMPMVEVTSLAPVASAAAGPAKHSTGVRSTASTIRTTPAPPATTASIAGVQEILKRSPLAGVNLGGWLCLEDWFFSGAEGSHVMSEGHTGQGACLPPMVTNVPEKWPSEGILAHRLRAENGTDFAIKVFKAHRESFMKDKDFEDIASLGIKLVRLPLQWGAFADALAPISKELYGSHDPVHDTVIVPDPFYKDDASLATIPRSFIEDILLKAQKHGLKVVLDIHAFPGGAQLGTYNSVWPMKPVFWKERAKVGTLGQRLVDAGSWIAQALIAWIQSLDATKRAVVAGVCFMNEPAHMNRWENFAKDEDVLAWLAGVADMFRTSKLPQQGVKLYMNIMDTGFKDFNGVAVPWFNKTFTIQERYAWAVADTHWYAAWTAGKCDGRTVPGGAYMCDSPKQSVLGTAAGCVKGEVQNMRTRFGRGLIAFSEISVGTFEDARYACKDRGVTSVLLDEMMIRFKNSDVQSFFWTWRMPFAPVFEPGWSLRWLAGLEEPVSARQACR